MGPTQELEVPGLLPSPAIYFHFSSADSRRAVVSYRQKYVHAVLVNHLGGLSLPRKSVVRLTDCPDMTIDVYPERKTTTQLKGKPSLSRMIRKLVLRYMIVERLNINSEICILIKA